MFSDFVSVCISEFLSGLRFSNRVFRLCFGLCNRICSGTVIHNSSHYATQRQIDDAWAYLSPAYFFFPLCLSFFFSFVHLLIFCFIFFFDNIALFVLLALFPSLFCLVQVLLCFINFLPPIYISLPPCFYLILFPPLFSMSLSL